VNRVGVLKRRTNTTALNAGIILITVVRDATFFSPVEALSCRYVETIATTQKTAL
jgi:hypothetical protein